MAKTRITMENVSEFLNTLPYAQFKALVEGYVAHTETNFDDEMKRLVTVNLQSRLEKLGVNSICPKCGSSVIVKNGKRANGIREYKCTACNGKFTLFTGTILEKTRWHWDVWIKVLEMTLNNYSIEKTVNVLEKDYHCAGIDPKTVWLWRLKLIHAMAAYPMPKLSGVIQVDETFIRESQKGSRNLYSEIKKEVRQPRYGRVPSKLGPLGPEFATVTTAIDNRGYCVCKVSGLGRLTYEQFLELFEPHFETISYICSDGNRTYEEYCEMFNIPHYIKPSSYNDLLTKNGYETPDFSDPVKAEETKTKNQKILQTLYKKGLIDRIGNRGELSYEEFHELKKSRGLNLGRVNELHSDLKKFVYAEKTNVSTKYLKDYVGCFAYIKNWTVAHGHYPSSSKDAEIIFEDILKLKVNYTVVDVENQQVDLPKPSGKYVSILQKETEKAREASANKYFKFDEEDGVKTFNKRDYLSDIPVVKFYAICKECGLTGYRKLSRWSVISTLMKHPDIDHIIYRLLQEDRHYKIAEEDLIAIADGKFAIKV